MTRAQIIPGTFVELKFPLADLNKGSVGCINKIVANVMVIQWIHPAELKVSIRVYDMETERDYFSVIDKHYETSKTDNLTNRRVDFTL